MDWIPIENCIPAKDQHIILLYRTSHDVEMDFVRDEYHVRSGKLQFGVWKFLPLDQTIQRLHSELPNWKSIAPECEEAIAWVPFKSIVPDPK